MLWLIKKIFRIKEDRIKYAICKYCGNDVYIVFRKNGQSYKLHANKTSHDEQKVETYDGYKIHDCQTWNRR